MATKKANVTTADAVVEETGSEIPWEETDKKPADAWEEEVEMIVPRKPKGEDQQFYICVNDRRYMVPADGKMQKLPRPVAEILRASIEAEYAADDYADHIPNRSGEQPQQHAII